ncbi:hypothetical protein KI387_026231, partial [Taxus chinensis]
AWIGCPLTELEWTVYHKTIACIDDLGVESVISGVRRVISIRTISTMQVKRCAQRGCQLFAIT